MTHYTITIRSDGSSDIPEAVRLRQVLKRLLRDYAFRCVGIRMVTGGPQSRPATPPTISANPQAQAKPIACTLATLAGVEAMDVEVEDLRDK